MPTMRDVAVMGIRSVIDARFKDGIAGVPEKELWEIAQEGRAKAAGFYTFTDEEFEALFEEQINITVKSEGVKIAEYYEPWINQENANIKWTLWSRYEKYLGAKMPLDVVRNLNKNSREIVDLLGNPRKDIPFFRRGLVIGDIQSGKTATYTAIAAKALDAGYKIVIIMTSNNDRLRRQTQGRIEKELVGTDMQGTIIPHGVADPKIVDILNATNVELYTSMDFDFGINFLNNQKLIKEGAQAVFVIKKQVNVLENVCQFIKKSFNTDAKVECPTLVLDDEADNASINVQKNKKDQQESKPSATNMGIRNILNQFERISYVGVTATPFANIFIPPDDFALEKFSADAIPHGRDLFPSDFIYLLPAPSNYIGSKAIFGSEADEEENIGRHHYMLEYINADELEHVFPVKHTKEFVPEKLPADLYTSMRYFLLVNAVRDKLGDEKKHRSMIVHISRFNDVQERTALMIDSWLDKVIEDVKQFSSLGAGVAEEKSDEIKSLHKVFEKMRLEEKAYISWNDLFERYLREAISKVCVKVQNGQKKHPPIDYDKFPAGLRVIVVGGNVLSRGMTFEGLCVSYFHRNSKMYDTLMQMGRWFGYRDGYAKFCKVWVTRGVAESFQFINRVVDEMKELIFDMHEAHKAPKEFGLHILCDPESNLLITGKDKMKGVTTTAIPKVLSKKVLQVARLPYNQNALKKNKNVVSNFLHDLPVMPGDYPADLVRTKKFWRGISSDIIADLISDFEMTVFNKTIAKSAVVRYIKENMQNVMWDVAIPEGDGGDWSQIISGQEAKIKLPNIAVGVDEKEQSELLIGKEHKRVVNPDHGKLGLNQEQISEIKTAYLAKHKDNKSDTVPFVEFLTEKHNPILLIYIIKPKTEDDGLLFSEPIYTIALGFPYVEGGEEVDYYAQNYVDKKQSSSEYQWEAVSEAVDAEEYDDEED